MSYDCFYKGRCEHFLSEGKLFYYNVFHDRDTFDGFIRLDDRLHGRQDNQRVLDGSTEVK